MITNVLLVTFAVVAIVLIIQHASKRNKIILGDENFSSKPTEHEEILKNLNEGKHE